VLPNFISVQYYILNKREARILTSPASSASLLYTNRNTYVNPHIVLRCLGFGVALCCSILILANPLEVDSDSDISVSSGSAVGASRHGQVNIRKPALSARLSSAMRTHMFVQLHKFEYSDTKRLGTNQSTRSHRIQTSSFRFGRLEFGVIGMECGWWGGV
jgi:hypothetical protein